MPKVRFVKFGIYFSRLQAHRFDVRTNSPPKRELGDTRQREPRAVSRGRQELHIDGGLECKRERNSFGAIAQLGEHLLCKQGVTSSSLVSSTKESPIAAIRAGCKPAAFRLRRFESCLSYQSVSEQALKVTKTIGTRFAEHPERELRHQRAARG